MAGFTTVLAAALGTQLVNTAVLSNQSRIARERAEGTARRQEERQDRLLQEQRVQEERDRKRQADVAARDAQIRRRRAIRETSGTQNSRSTIATSPLGIVDDSTAVGKALLGL